VVLALVGLIASMTQTMVLPLIPRLPALLHTSPASASWVVTAALLAGAAVNPIAGRIGDTYGKRRTVVVLLVLLVIGSLLDAIASSLTFAVVGRALQGAALAVIPLGISILRERLPNDMAASATSVMSTMLGVGSAIALPVSAVIVTHADWHLLYYATAAVSLLAVLLVVVWVPRDATRLVRPAFDVLGAAGLAVGLTALLLAVSEGGVWGWSSPAVLCLLVGGILVLAAWSRWEWRHREPLVNLRSSSRRTVLLTNIVAILIGFATYALAYVFSQLMQVPRSSGFGLGLSTLTAAVLVAPGGVLMLVVSPLVGRAIRRWGGKIVLVLGCSVVACGWAVALAMTRSSGVVMKPRTKSALAPT